LTIMISFIRTLFCLRNIIIFKSQTILEMTILGNLRQTL
jgi:hypothetical protein